MEVNINTENSDLLITSDILISLEADNLTGFTKLFRRNICLMNYSPYIVDYKIPDLTNNSQKEKMTNEDDFEFRDTFDWSKYENNTRSEFIKFDKQILDKTDQSLPDDFEIILEMEQHLNTVELQKQKWSEQCIKIEKLRQTVLQFLCKERKDNMMGKLMLFGDPTLTDVNCLSSRN